MGLDAVRRFQLPTFASTAGDLTVVEGLPFDIRRAFFIHDIPEGARRGSHANRDEHVLVAISGGLELLLDDGFDSDTWSLSRPDEGVYVPAMIWRELRDFSASTTCLVLSSRRYDRNDYIRDYDQFITEARSEGSTVAHDGLDSFHSDGASRKDRGA